MAQDPPLDLRHDPVAFHTIGQRFARVMRLGAAFSIVIAGIAVLMVARGQSDIRVHMLIATALGAGFTVLLGIALMSLIFLSHQSGHDSAAAAPPSDESKLP